MDETTSEVKVSPPTIIKTPKLISRDPTSFGSDVMQTAKFPFSGGSKSTPSEIPRFKVPSEVSCPFIFVRSVNGPLEMSRIIETKTFMFGSGSDVSKGLGYDPSPECPSSGEIPYGISYLNDTDRTLMVLALRDDLKHNEEIFKRQYCYAPTLPSSCLSSSAFCFPLNMQERDFVRGRPRPASRLSGESSGIPWAAVYGIDEICVVTLTGHVDLKRVRGCLASTDAKTVLSIFRKCVLSELEDLADPSSERRKELSWSLDMPFGAVSATWPTLPPYGRHHEDEAPAGLCRFIDLLLGGNQMADNIQDSGDAIRLAIYIFRRLIRKKFEAEEIEVTVVSGRRHGVLAIKDLEISEIGDCLASMDQDI